MHTAAARIDVFERGDCGDVARVTATAVRNSVVEIADDLVDFELRRLLCSQLCAEAVERCQLLAAQLQIREEIRFLLHGQAVVNAAHDRSRSASSLHRNAVLSVEAREASI